MGSTSMQDSGTVVNNAIREISHIATLPEVTLKIVELVEDPSSTAQDLHGVIGNDPALCSRVLKVVNSAFYGLPGQVASIDRAIVLLGLNAVKNIAIAASLVKLFRGGELCPSFSARDLWQHSVGVAATSKMIVERIGMGMVDEAFLGGLIHDIGVLVELQYDRQRLLEVIERLNLDDNGVPQEDMRDIEQRVFGATHEQFGKGLCERWKFPPSLQFITGHHHDPFALPEEQRTLACVVHVADKLTAGVGGGFRLDLVDLNVGERELDSIGLTQEQLTQIRADLPRALEEVSRMLG